MVEEFPDNNDYKEFKNNNKIEYDFKFFSKYMQSDMKWLK